MDDNKEISYPPCKKCGASHGMGIEDMKTGEITPIDICKDCLFGDWTKIPEGVFDMKMIVPDEPDMITKKRIEEDLEFIKNCCGINEELLGKNESHRMMDIPYDLCKAGHYHKGHINDDQDNWKCDICGALINRNMD